MNKKTLFLVLLGILLLPTLTLAVLPGPGPGPAAGNNVTIQTMAAAAVQTTLYIAGAIVVILWVVTGLLFLTASGNPAKLTSARTALLASIAGTVLVIVAASATSIVSSAFGL